MDGGIYIMCFCVVNASESLIMCRHKISECRREMSVCRCTMSLFVMYLCACGSVYMYVRDYEYLCTCMCVITSICVHVCACVFVCSCVYPHTHTLYKTEVKHRPLGDRLSWNVHKGNTEIETLKILDQCLQSPERYFCHYSLLAENPCAQAGDYQFYLKHRHEQQRKRIRRVNSVSMDTWHCERAKRLAEFLCGPVDQISENSCQRQPTTKPPE